MVGGNRLMKTLFPKPAAIEKQTLPIYFVRAH